MTDAVPDERAAILDQLKRERAAALAALQGACDRRRRADLERTIAELERKIDQSRQQGPTG